MTGAKRSCAVMAQYASLAADSEDVTSLRQSSRSLRCLQILPYLPAGSTKPGRSICCGAGQTAVGQVSLLLGMCRCPKSATLSGAISSPAPL